MIFVHNGTVALSVWSKESEKPLQAVLAGEPFLSTQGIIKGQYKSRGDGRIAQQEPP
jgi:hypothetical protein